MKPGEVIPKRALLLEQLHSQARTALLSNTELPDDIAFVEMIQQERRRQDEKWGDANYSLNLDGACTVLTEELGEFAQQINDLRLGHTVSDVQCLVELVQTAAVAQSIYEQVIARLRKEKRDGKCSSSD